MGKKVLSKSAEKRRAKEETARAASWGMFSKFYQDQYGAERWGSLLPSLQAEGKYVALINKYADRDFTEKLLGYREGTEEFSPGLFKCMTVYVRDGGRVKCEGVEEEEEEGEEKDVIEEEEEDRSDALLHDPKDPPFVWPSPGLPSSLDPSGLCVYYPLDAASLMPVHLLRLEPHHRVLDMCAAPGGKSLAILQYLDPSRGSSLTCNDISPGRRARLKNVIRRYIPKDVMDGWVDVVGGDATSKRFIDSFRKASFDRVLLDAPCSSERHLLNKPSDMKLWAPGRSKGNADRQLLLLLAALRLCKVGGRVVYSTCSLSEVENDKVVMKAIKKANGKIKGCKVVLCDVGREEVPLGEKTEVGWHILPDRSNGWGPIYMTALEVVEDEEYVEGDGDGDEGEE